MCCVRGDPKISLICYLVLLWSDHALPSWKGPAKLPRHNVFSFMCGNFMHVPSKKVKICYSNYQRTAWSWRKKKIWLNSALLAYAAHWPEKWWASLHRLHLRARQPSGWECFHLDANIAELWLNGWGGLFQLLPVGPVDQEIDFGFPSIFLLLISIAPSGLVNIDKGLTHVPIWLPDVNHAECALLTLKEKNPLSGYH